MKSPNEKINYAVVGLGIGCAHADAVIKDDRAVLSAVCDLREDRLEAAAQRYPSARRLRDFDAVLADPSIDGVSICTQSGYHADLAVEAMKAGKNVLIEKPLDVTVAAAQRIVDTWRGSGVRAGGVFQNRHNAASLAIRRAMEEKRLGKLILATFAVKWYRNQSYYDGDGAWRGTWALDGGGSLINQSIHTVDLMQWLCGGVESVCSTGGVFNHNIETEDATASIIKFKNGARGTFVSTTCAYPGVSTDIFLCGEGGSLGADADRLTLWKLTDGDPDEEAEMLDIYGGNEAAAAADPSLLFGHDCVLHDFVSALIEERDPEVTPDEAIKALKIVEAVYTSVREGREVTL